MSRSARFLFRCKKGIFSTLFSLVIFLLVAGISNAQVGISGPTPTEDFSSGGQTVPNPYMGDRTIYPGNVPVLVGGQVGGGTTVNISGLASPFGSVILKDENDQFLRSTVADNLGYFTFTSVAIREGADKFCFQTIDYKRLGESESCLDTQPINSTQSIKDVFLPPTIGLFAKQINEGQEALIYGYSMPGADVDILVKTKTNFKIKAGTDGYYEYRYDKVPAGTYLLASTAKLSTLSTLNPLNEEELKVLSLPEQATTKSQEIAEEAINILTTTLFGFFLFLLLLLIVIIVLLLLIKPAWMVILLDKLKNKPVMHHDWLLIFIEQNQ